MNIRPLTEADALEYRLIRLRMLREHPESFGASADAFEAVSTHAYEETFAERIEAPNRFILGAFLDGALVGTAGFWRHSGEKDQHKGGIWGMYVAEGVGTPRRLMLLSSFDSGCPWGRAVPLPVPHTSTVFTSEWLNVNDSTALIRASSFRSSSILAS